MPSAFVFRRPFEVDPLTQHLSAIAVVSMKARPMAMDRDADRPQPRARKRKESRRGLEGDTPRRLSRFPANGGPEEGDWDLCRSDIRRISGGLASGRTRRVRRAVEMKMRPHAREIKAHVERKRHSPVKGTLIRRKKRDAVTDSKGCEAFFDDFHTASFQGTAPQPVGGGRLARGHRIRNLAVCRPG